MDNLKHWLSVDFYTGGIGATDGEDAENKADNAGRERHRDHKPFECSLFNARLQNQLATISS